jgi:glutathione synthase/RimK-type ligase-like ATP-grasp enzyme
MTVLGVYRERLFSPGKVNEDAAIMDRVLEELRGQGISCRAVGPEDVEHIFVRPPWVLSMAQSERVLGILEAWERDGSCIVNSSQAIRNCYRKALLPLLHQAHLPLPESVLLPLPEVEQRAARGDAFLGCWLKRGDVHAMAPEDVVRISSVGDFREALQTFRQRGVADLLIQQHVDGREVKFYAVRTGFFSAYWMPGGTAVSEDLSLLADLADSAASALGLDIYGGDAIVTRSGGVLLIDINDWPSFSRCRESAARYIAQAVLSRLDGARHEI